MSFCAHNEALGSLGPLPRAGFSPRVAFHTPRAQRGPTGQKTVKDLRLRFLTAVGMRERAALARAAA
eukprot:9175995-Pyramimonas_sp.AAC.1